MLADEHYWYHQKEFLPMLLTPHVALLVLPIARAILPEKYMTDSNVEFSGTVYKFLWGATNFGGGLLFTRVTVLAWNYSGVGGILQQLWEHPAVSSVAFDTTFCWITWTMWWVIQNRSVSDAIDVEEKDDGYAGAGSGRTTTRVDDDSSVRRRQT